MWACLHSSVDQGTQRYSSLLLVDWVPSSLVLAATIIRRWKW